MSDCLQDIPVRVFASAIDRQILAYSDNRRKGLDRVANVLRDSKTMTGGVLQLVDMADTLSSAEGVAEGGSGKKKDSIDTKEITENKYDKKSSPQSNGRESTFRRSILSWMGRKSVVKNPGTDKASEAILNRSTRFKTLSSLFYECDETSIAHNLTMRLHYMYCCIPLHEFCIDFGYGGKSKALCPMLARLRSESERLQELFINEILIPTDVLTRAEVVIQVIKVGELLARLRSHHALMMIVFALQSHAVHRLKNTWAVVNARMPGRWDILQDLVGFGGQKLTTNFCSRQSKEGISQDSRERLFMTLPDMAIGSGIYPLMMQSETFRDIDFCQLNASALRVSEDGARLSFMISSSKPDDGIDADSSYDENYSVASAKRRGTVSIRSRAGTEATRAHGNRSNSLFEPGTSQRAKMLALSRKREAGMSHITLRTDKFKINPPIHGKPDASHKLRRALSEGSMPIFQGGISHVSQLPDHSASRSSGLFGAYTADKHSHGGHRKTVKQEANDPAVGRTRRDSNSSRSLSYTYMSSDMVKLRDEIDVSTMTNTTHACLLEESVTDDSTSHCGTYISEEDGLHHQVKKSFRQHAVHASRSRSKKMIGIVRSDGLDDAGGLPKASKKAHLPFLNGILSRIIRLNEVPDFIKARANDDADGSGYLKVGSPGTCCSVNTTG